MIVRLKNSFSFQLLLLEGKGRWRQLLPSDFPSLERVRCNDSSDDGARFGVDIILDEHTRIPTYHTPTTSYSLINRVLIFDRSPLKRCYYTFLLRF
ncbi:hypothetical protein GUJ93_ZPchr0003g18137 [Zizania palustris]|uniref:Uncharacterized protein n=1 Tax=Zizania palustris TaxID=103762 RepID=A0A8J5VXY3_ZIZPA|nr:hypothetical protein GUJ93_ZPchr0003g18137 [Zizania palustris]